MKDWDWVAECEGYVEAWFGFASDAYGNAPTASEEFVVTLQPCGTPASGAGAFLVRHELPGQDGVAREVLELVQGSIASLGAGTSVVARLLKAQDGDLVPEYGGGSADTAATKDVGIIVSAPDGSPAYGASVLVADNASPSVLVGRAGLARQFRADGAGRLRWVSTTAQAFVLVAWQDCWFAGPISWGDGDDARVGLNKVAKATVKLVGGGPFARMRVDLRIELDNRGPLSGVSRRQRLLDEVVPQVFRWMCMQDATDENGVLEVPVLDDAGYLLEVVAANGMRGTARVAPGDALLAVAMR